MNRVRGASVALALALGAGAAQAFVVTIAPGTRALFLQVGNGTVSGTGYSSGGTPANNTLVNEVSVDVPASSVGTGVAQPMTSNSTQARSAYDNFVFCAPPAQVYVGGFFRIPSGASTASLTATSPANLVSAAGDRIPFGQISWTSSGIGDTGAQPIPAGTFNGATLTLASFPSNTWRESCLTFSYGNTNVVPFGTYTGRVTYTLSAP
jgi:hypothetical protein